MKHIVEFKFPSMFKRKERVVEVSDSDDPNIEEVIVETSKRIEDAGNVIKFVVPVIALIAVGYIAGYNRGMLKGVLRENTERVIVITNREGS